MIYPRRGHELDNLNELPSVLLEIETALPKLTVSTCDCYNCEGQDAVWYCLDCVNKICDTHQQVGTVLSLTLIGRLVLYLV